MPAHESVPAHDGLAVEVRPAAPEDLSTLVELYRTCFPAARARPLDEVRHKLRELFFDGPFASAQVPSLVALDGDGMIVGFRGWLKRCWRLGDELLEARTENSRMVHPSARRRGVGSAIQEAGRKIIAGLSPDMFAFGGDAATSDGLSFNRGTQSDGVNVYPLPQYGFAWEIERRPLRTDAVGRLAGRLGQDARERFAQGLAALLPRRDTGPTGAETLRGAPLGPQGLAECYDALGADFPLHLDEKPEDREWLLGYLEAYPSRGQFQGRVLCTQAGEPIGFYVAYLRAELLEVVGLGVLQDHLPSATAHLLQDAAALRARRVTGIASARQVRALVACGATIGAGPACRCNTARADIRLQFESMQALFSGLEGERWT